LQHLVAGDGGQQRRGRRGRERRPREGVRRRTTGRGASCFGRVLRRPRGGAEEGVRLELQLDLVFQMRKALHVLFGGGRAARVLAPQDLVVAHFEEGGGVLPQRGLFEVCREGARLATAPAPPLFGLPFFQGGAQRRGGKQGIDHRFRPPVANQVGPP